LILVNAWLVMHPIAAIERLIHGKEAQPVGQMMD
jgi:hypothetical protein